MDTTCISYKDSIPGKCTALKPSAVDCDGCKFKKTREEQLAIQKKCAKRLKKLKISYEPLIEEE